MLCQCLCGALLTKGFTLRFFDHEFACFDCTAPWNYIINVQKNECQIAVKYQFSLCATKEQFNNLTISHKLKWCTHQCLWMYDVDEQNTLQTRTLNNLANTKDLAQYKHNNDSP